MKSIKSKFSILIAIFICAIAVAAQAAGGTYGASSLDFARGLTPSENANTVAGTSNTAPTSGSCTQAWHYRTVTFGPNGSRYIAVYTQACNL